MRTLNTVPTANGQRAGIALEECGLEVDIHFVDLMAGEHRSSEMLELNDVSDGRRVSFATARRFWGLPAYQALGGADWATRGRTARYAGLIVEPDCQ
jgi:hypothetical protein